jgi:hypothetical protein
MLAEGPAAGVFARKLPRATKISALSGQPDVTRIVCGTSWPGRVEWEAVGLARRLGIPSVAILDHWVNYRRRFERDGTYHWPDEVWVCDETALRLARTALPEVPIRLIENPYRLDVLEAAQRLTAEPSTAGIRILYVTEPTAEAALLLHGDPRFFGYTEDEALRGFLARVAAWPDVRAIIIRAHPSEPPEKYAWACVHPRVRLDATSPLVAQLAWADVVVGCNSMAMVVATWVGKRVLCAIPEGGRGFALPTEGIEFLSVIAHPITERESA